MHGMCCWLLSAVAPCIGTPAPTQHTPSQVPDAAAVDRLYAADVYAAAPTHWPPLGAYKAASTQEHAVEVSVLQYAYVAVVVVVVLYM